MKQVVLGFLFAGVATSALLAETELAPRASAGEAPLMNPSDVPPWGPGPQPVPEPSAPLLPALPQPDKFLLGKPGEPGVDVTEQVLVLTDSKTGAQFLVLILSGQQPVMVRR